MSQLTSDAQYAIQGLAQRYGLSLDAVTTMLYAVSNGGGTMAQFNVPELGGSGQWMQGGMTMVGDMFNYGLQSKVSGLCSELSSLLRSQNVFAPQPQYAPAQQQYQGQGGYGFQSFASSVWPAELGQPSSSGGQNDVRYAVFPHVARLAIDRAGQVTVYDTLDHNIGGVQQQQGGPSGTLSFTSQRGTFTVDSLPVVSGAGVQQPQQSPQPQPQFQPQMAAPVQQATGDAPRTQSELLTALERLGDLYQKGILTDSEFQAKKAELLSRI